MRHLPTFTLLLTLLLSGSVPYSYAQISPISQYTSVIEVIPAASDLPTVLSVPLPTDADRVLVRENNTGVLLASLLVRQTITDAVTYFVTGTVAEDELRGQTASLMDNDGRTYVDLLITTPTSNIKQANFQIRASQPRQVSEVNIAYDQNSVRPRSVSLFAVSPIGEELVVKSTSFNSNRLVFPARVGQNWRLVFEYDQPIRVTDISFGPVQVSSVVDTVRFLAQPSETYSVYLYPENAVSEPVFLSIREGGDLRLASAISPDTTSPVMPNPAYISSDSDADGIPDVRDNCPRDYNPDQVSSRGSLKGDVCDDFDNDRFNNAVDNCPFIPNSNQADRDADGIGDECDESESRLTEQYPWLPWVGIGVTLMVLLGLFVTVARQPLPMKPTTTDSLAQAEEDKEVQK